MAEYSPDHINILLAQMVRSTSVIEAVVASQLDGPHICRSQVGGVPEQAVLFTTILEFYREHGTAPDDAALMADVESYVDRYFRGEKQRRRVSRRVQEFISWKVVVDHRSEGLARKMIARIADLCIIQPAVRELLEDPARSGVLEGVTEKLNALEARQASLSGGLSSNGLVSLEMPKTGERVPTYLPWFDSRAGDGLGIINGSTIGIVAPQSAGKTTLGIEMAVAQALMGEHSLLVLAEEGLSQSMRSKIIGCALGVPYELFKTQSISQVVESQGLDKELAAKKLANLDQYLNVLDMVSHNLVSEGLPPIVGEIAQLRSRGSRPRFVYVDWAGVIANAVSKVTKRTKEAEIQDLSFGLAHEAFRSNCVIAISQQMSPETIKRGPTFVPDMYCAADCRQFNAPMKYALAINKQDQRSGLQLLTWVKARDDQALDSTCIMRLRGEIPQFVDVGSEYEVRGRRFMRRTATSRAPSER